MKTLLFTIIVCVAFVGCLERGLDSSVPPNTTVVPDGAILLKEEIQRPAPPNGWTSVICWLQAATLSPTQTNQTAMIYIDYMMLLEHNTSSQITDTIEVINYDSIAPRPLFENEGGLYRRIPSWFCCNDSHTVMTNSMISNNVLSIDLSQSPDRIAHWWTTRQLLKPNCKYYLLLRVKIDGKASIQIGSDWWITINSPWCGDNVCNSLAWISDWYGDTGGNYITIKSPINY
jgi:hypothetical protein